MLSALLHSLLRSLKRSPTGSCSQLFGAGEAETAALVSLGPSRFAYRGREAQAVNLLPRIHGLKTFAGQEKSPQSRGLEGLIVNSGRRALVLHAHLLVDQPLLGDREDVVGQPVQHQAGWEDEEHDAESQRHEPHHLGLHRIR